PVAAGRERRAEVVVPEDHLRRQAHDEEEWAALRRAEGLVRDLDAVGARGGHATVPRRACGRRSSACCRVRRRTTEVDGLPAPEPAPASRPRRRTVFCRRGLTTTSARPRPARRVDGAQTGGGCPERDDTLHGFRI